MTGTELERLYREHGHMVFRRARHILGDEEEAKDIVQDLFTQLARGAAFDGRSLVTTFLYAATTNLCLTRLRDSGKIVGGSSILLIDPELPTVEIGFTWILPEWQRTHVNTEAKLVQLTHCFESLGSGRVELKTDIRNQRSRAAIARIGATEEGVLRAHRRRLDGSLRDSVLFSILASEWPVVRDALRARLDRSAAT